MAEEEKTGNVVNNTEFKSAGDWINQIMAKFCTEFGVGAVEAVEAVAEVKDDDGKVTQEAVPAVRGKKGKDVINVDAIEALALANNIKLKEGGYPNAGMTRMNVGNMLRAAAKKRHGLNLPQLEEGEVLSAKSDFEFTSAPDDFEVNGDKPSHNPDGSKIAAPKADEEAA